MGYAIPNSILITDVHNNVRLFSYKAKANPILHKKEKKVDVLGIDEINKLMTENAKKYIN